MCVRACVGMSGGVGGGKKACKRVSDRRDGAGEGERGDEREG